MARKLAIIAASLILALLVGGFLLLQIAIAIPSVVESRARSNVLYIQTELRTIAEALQSYNADHGEYPAPDPTRDGWPQLPSALTTPKAYLHSMPRNPFAPRGIAFGYALLGENPEPWSSVLDSSAPTPAFILLSPGPTKETGPFRLDWNMVYDPTNGSVSPGYIYRFGGVSATPPVAFTYDPSNGTSSWAGPPRLRP